MSKFKAKNGSNSKDGDGYKDKRNARKRPKSTGSGSNNTTPRKFSDRNSDMGSSKVDGTKMSPNNHIEWYNKVPSLYEPAFSVATYPALGYALTKRVSNSYVGTYVTAQSIPGIMSFAFVPMIGEAEGPESPINKVGQALWKKFRSGLTSNGWYEPADLVMYVLAVDSIIMTINHLTRMYGIATWYDACNRMLPDGLMQSMGIDPNDPYINQNLPNFRMAINKLILQMQTYHVPSGFDILTRHSWLASNVFKDSDNELSQLYVFYPKYMYTADVTTTSSSTPGSRLVPTYLSCGQSAFEKVTIQSILDTVQNAIVMLQEVFDAIKLSAEVDRVFGNSIFTISEVPEGYTVGASYNADVLQQITNMSIITDFIPNDIEQKITDVGSIAQRSYVHQSHLSHFDTPYGGLYAGIPIVDFLTSNPTKDDVCYATRFMVATRPSVNMTTSAPSYDMVCGTEIISEAAVIENDATETEAVGSWTLRDYHSHVALPKGTASVRLDANSFIIMSYMRIFEAAPRIKWFITNWTESDIPEDFNMYTTVYDMGTKRNLAVVQYDALHAMHEAAVYSMFNYPLIG